MLSRRRKQYLALTSAFSSPGQTSPVPSASSLTPGTPDPSPPGLPPLDSLQIPVILKLLPPTRQNFHLFCNPLIPSKYPPFGYKWTQLQFHTPSIFYWLFFNIQQVSKVSEKQEMQDLSSSSLQQNTDQLLLSTHCSRQKAMFAKLRCL